MRAENIQESVPERSSIPSTPTFQLLYIYLYNIISMISDSSSEGNEPTNNYSLLLERVGNDGKYQWVFYALIAMYSIFSSIIISSVSLLYLDAQFDCTAFNVPQIECEHYICENLPAEQRHLYPQSNSI